MEGERKLFVGFLWRRGVLSIWMIFLSTSPGDEVPRKQRRINPAFLARFSGRRFVARRL